MVYHIKLSVLKLDLFALNDITTLVFVRNFFLYSCLVCKVQLLFFRFTLAISTCLICFYVILYNNLMERFPKTVTIFSIHTALVVDNFTTLPFEVATCRLKIQFVKCVILY